MHECVSVSVCVGGRGKGGRGHNESERLSLTHSLGSVFTHSLTHWAVLSLTNSLGSAFGLRKRRGRVKLSRMYAVPQY